MTFIKRLLQNTIAKLTQSSPPVQAVMTDRVNLFFKVTNNDTFLSIVKAIYPKIDPDQLIKIDGSYVINHHLAYTINAPACNISTYFIDSTGQFREITIQQYHKSRVNALLGEFVTLQTAKVVNLSYRRTGDIIHYCFNDTNGSVDITIDINKLQPSTFTFDILTRQIVKWMTSYRRLYFVDRQNKVCQMDLLYDPDTIMSSIVNDYRYKVVGSAPYGLIHEADPTLVFVDSYQNPVNVYTLTTA
jgi:hypothetical protein